MSTVESGEEERRDFEMEKEMFFATAGGNRSYTIQRIIGEGAYGVVCSAVDNKTKELVAVKRLARVFDLLPEAARILRELKFLRLLGGHENIISIRSVLLPDDRDKFNEIFVVFELMPTDLNRLLRSTVSLSAEHVRWLTYQIVRALYYLHSSHIFHRDLKPSNLLVNADCDLRLCDFGLARAASNSSDTVFWTDYVATRWYRAPELIMSYLTTYSTAIDMWGLGCILAEMLNDGTPLFPGENGYHQLELIHSLLGRPDSEALRKIPDTTMKQYFMSLPNRDPRPLKEIFNEAQPDALAFLRRLIQLDPDRRPTAEEALRDPYFQDIFIEEDLIQADPIPDHEFAFELEKQTEEKLRSIFLEEILHYHPEMREKLVGNLRMDPSQLRFDVPSEVTDFRGQFKQVQGEEVRREDNFVSMPNQRLGNMGDDIMVDSPLRNDVDPMTLSTPIQIPSTGLSYGLLHDRRMSMKEDR